MARATRPPSLTTLMRRLLRDEARVGAADLVLCACSGGPDSTALLHGLALLRRRLRHRLAAVGVDHGLRPEAADELERVSRLAHDLDVPFVAVSLTVAPGGNLQARARKARHAALQQVARDRGATMVALGHTADDRAETVLMRLMRGAGPAGLAVMPPFCKGVGPASAAPHVPLVRPLLRGRRSDVLRHLTRHHLSFADDPSNHDARFLRTRVRTRLLPLLEEISPGIVTHLCALADELDDGQDDPLAGLGRAQRLAISRLLRSGRGRCTVRLSGGLDLELRYFRNSAVVSDEQ